MIPNGVVFSDLPAEEDKVLALGLEPGRYVLTVGRLVPEKRQLDLLRAFSDAALDGWKLVIVGRIDHKNKYADLLASEAGVRENVVMAGFQGGESLRQLYAHAGLFVLPSSHEGLPIVLLEALSYGLPVLVSDIPSNLEVVGDPAQVFRMGDIQELRAKITAMTAVKLDQCSARRSGAIVSVATIGRRSRSARQPHGTISSVPSGIPHSPAGLKSRRKTGRARCGTGFADHSVLLASARNDCGERASVRAKI